MNTWEVQPTSKAIQRAAVVSFNHFYLSQVRWPRHTLIFQRNDEWMGKIYREAKGLRSQSSRENKCATDDGNAEWNYWRTEIIWSSRFWLSIRSSFLATRFFLEIRNDNFHKFAIQGFVIVDNWKLIFIYTLGPFIGHTGPSSDSLNGREWSGLTLWLMILPRSSVLVGMWGGGEKGWFEEGEEGKEDFDGWGRDFGWLEDGEEGG